jgi:anaphase-promoting complex subunit 2
VRRAHAQQDDKFNLPAEVQERLDAYAARFLILKTPRKLVWQPASGCVELRLTVAGVQLDLSVTPLQATLLMHFKVGSVG